MWRPISQPVMPGRCLMICMQNYVDIGGIGPRPSGHNKISFKVQVFWTESKTGPYQGNEMTGKTQIPHKYSFTVYLFLANGITWQYWRPRASEL